MSSTYLFGTTGPNEKKKADNLPIANSFLIRKLKRIQKNWKPLLQVMANMSKQTNLEGILYLQ